MRADPPPGCAVLIAGPAEAALFDAVADDVFDGPVDPGLLSEFLADPRHHIAVARAGGRIVGMITGVTHIHPDNPVQMWINELGGAPAHRRRGIARALLAAFLDHARSLGCTEAWVVADPTPGAEGFWSDTGAPRTGDRLAMFSFPLTGCRPRRPPAVSSGRKYSRGEREGGEAPPRPGPARQRRPPSGIPGTPLTAAPGRVRLFP